MSVTKTDRNGKGTLSFSHAVNMINVYKKFNEIFNVYVLNTAKKIDELKTFEVTSYVDNNETK